MEPRGPEPGPDADQQAAEPGLGPVPVREAARRLGISERAVRKRIHAGTMQGQFLDNAWLVWLPSAEPPGPEQGRGSEVPMGRGTGTGTGPEPLHAFAQVLATLTEHHRADLALLTEAHARELAGKDAALAELQRAHADALAARAALVDELRRRAEQAEADLAARMVPPAEPRRSWWRRLLGGSPRRR